jgi:hypothetical protein
MSGGHHRRLRAMGCIRLGPAARMSNPRRLSCSDPRRGLVTKNMLRKAVAADTLATVRPVGCCNKWTRFCSLHVDDAGSCRTTWRPVPA